MTEVKLEQPAALCEHDYVRTVAVSAVPGDDRCGDRGGDGGGVFGGHSGQAASSGGTVVKGTVS